MTDEPGQVASLEADRPLYDSDCWQIPDASARDSTAEFLAAAAHELRLPLSHIKGFVTSLRRSDVEWDNATRNDFLADIEQETDRLVELVESLLGARESNRGKKRDTNLELTQPAAVVRGALHRTRGVIRDRRLQLDLPPNLPSVRMDAEQMERVLANLIVNAVKYSPPGSPIGISARITCDGDMDLSVADEGPGIPVEDRERIFEPFFRTRAAERSNIPGHGLGLAISQCIVRRQGGRIYVSNRSGGGARFHVVLPTPVRVKSPLSDYRLKEQSSDTTKYSRRGRRGPDAQASIHKPQGKWLPGTVGSGWNGGIETDRGASIRPAAA